MPELLPENEKISSIVNGPGCDPLGSVSELVEAVVDISNQLPAHGKLILDISWEEVLGKVGRKETVAFGLLSETGPPGACLLICYSSNPAARGPTRSGGG